MSAAAQRVTSASRSNLSLGFITLPPPRRRDIITFYAFCRLVDDIADAAALSLEEKKQCLAQWRAAVSGEEISFADPANQEIARELRAVVARYKINAEHLREIIAGCEMDLEPRGFETIEDLLAYCRRVAVAVGLVSIEIFGYQNDFCYNYAYALGLGLQFTNILRDVGVDYANGGRIYLPRVQLRRFGYGEEEIARGVRNENFLALMRHNASLTWNYFRGAERALPYDDRAAMIPAETMRRVYMALLRKMERDDFRVFEKTYRVSRPRKLLCLAGAWWQSKRPFG